MNKEEQLNKIAIFRYGIIAPLVTKTIDPSISEYTFFMQASKKVYLNIHGEETMYSVTTIARWYRIYQKEGFEGLKPQRRVDKGQSRKMDDDIKSQIQYLKQEYPKLPSTIIYQKLIDTCTISKRDISLSTVTRYVKHLKQKEGLTNHKDMRRYERKHINEVWCGDSSVGPYITVDGKKKRLYILALIDDASRFITGVNIFYQDTFVNLMTVMQSAITKFGKPKVFNFDNGSPYKNQQMELLAARIGFTISYCAPYQPIQKAKIERWFSTLKQQWVSQLDMKDFKNIEEVRRSLYTYVQVYNTRVHSSLEKISPQERFFSESNKIQRISQERIAYGFLLELKRKVSKDNVVLLNGKE